MTLTILPMFADAPPAGNAVLAGIGAAGAAAIASIIVALVTRKGPPDNAGVIAAGSVALSSELLDLLTKSNEAGAILAQGLRDEAEACQADRVVLLELVAAVPHTIDPAVLAALRERAGLYRPHPTPPTPPTPEDAVA